MNDIVDAANDWSPDWVHESPRLVRMANSRKDEFRTRILKAIQLERGWGYSSRTIGSPADGRRVEELIPNTDDPLIDSRLWLLNRTDGIVAVVVGRGDSGPQSVDPWLKAVETASRQLGQRRRVRWRAYLAQSDPYMPSHRYRLSADVALAERTWLVAGPGIVSNDALAVVGQVMATQTWSALIQINGSTPCYDWDGDGQTAALQRARILAALVSLAWDSPWLVREGPTDRLDQRWAGAPGPISGSHYGWTSDMSGLLVPPARDLPSWVAATDRTLLQNAAEHESLRRALLMHHEGVLVQKEHPSIALLAFVSVIESLTAEGGSKLVRCDSCDQIIGSTRRFKEAVETVLPPDEAAYLVGAYDARSRTVHDAHLHGRERYAGGWGEMSLYQADPIAEFEMRTVRYAEKASKAMIVQLLESLPA